MAQTMPEKRVPEKLPIQFRAMSMPKGGDKKPMMNMDEEKRTFSLVFSTETPVARWFGREILSHDPKHVRMDRMHNRAALLCNHDPECHVGVVEGAAIDPKEKCGRADVRMGMGEKATEKFQDVKDDILCHVSVGYQVHHMTMIESDANDGDTYLVDDWEPVEISLVPVPADPNAGVGRNLEVREFPVAVTRPEITAVQAETTEVVRMADEKATAPAVEVVRENPDASVARNVAVEIMACGKAYDIPDADVQNAIRDGMSLETFKAYAAGILDQRIRKMKANQGSGVAEHVVSNLTEREKAQYSILRLIASCDPENHVEAGLEREVASEIAKRSGTPGHGGLWIPTRLHTRSGLDTKTDAAGKYSVFSEPQDLIELLRNRSLVIGKLGATVLSGLEGNPAFPVHATAPAITWVAENPGSDVSDADSTLGQKTMTPKMASMTTSYSRKFAAQSTLDAESFVRKDLADGHALGVDLAAIAGSGSSNQPLGLLGTTGIGDVAGGTNGAVPTYDLMVDLETKLATSNADVAGIKFLTTPGIRGKLRKTQEFSSTNGKPVWTGDGSVQGAGAVLGYDAWVSNQVPSTLTKGNQSLSHAIILGYWPDLLIGEWGALEIVVDPYAKKKQGMIEVTSYQMVDVLLRYPARFAAMQDALVA